MTTYGRYPRGARVPLSQRLGGVPRTCRMLGIRCDGRSLAPCPACGAAPKTLHGGRLPRGGAHRVSVTASGYGWRCHGCQASGGAAQLVAYAWYGRPFDALDRERVRELIARVDRECGTEAVVPAYVPPPDPREVQRARARQPITYRGQRIDWDELRDEWIQQRYGRLQDEYLVWLARPEARVLGARIEMARRRAQNGGDR